MKALRTLLTLFLIAVILGGLGYIGYITYGGYLMGGMSPQEMVSMPNMTDPSNNSTASQNGDGHGTTGGGTQTTGAINTIAVQNRDRLNQAIGTITQAIDLITIDPYAKATLPSTNPNTSQQGAVQGKTSEGSGTINIYPSGDSSVNIGPNNSPNNPTSSVNTNQGTTQQSQNFVYDQGKLQQLNNGIFTLAQGIMTINQLNDDLLSQSSMAEATPANYQTYVARYNTALQNKAQLNSAMSLLSRASLLINVNPYAPSNGYPYNPDVMAQIHQGVFKLAQGMVMLNRLNEDFTRQMADASMQAQVNTSYQNNSMTSSGFLGNINMSTMFNLILIVMVVGLIAGILGAIFSVFRKNKPNPSNDPKLL